MKTKGYLGRSDGQISGPLAGLIVGVVVLFVGLFAISVVSDVIPGLTENAFTVASNTTAIEAGAPLNSTYSFSIATIVDNTVDYVTVGISNTTLGEAAATPWVINVSLNGVNIANIAQPLTSSETNITSVGILANIVNNITFGNETAVNANATTRIDNATIVYASSLENTAMGTISDGLIATTGTIFSVLGIVIIIVALSMAIQSLRRET